ncbi:MAG TPA: TonB-dependent receptor [Candidatus Sulfotelmatobacter sp.]|nr:TonB-dependent receptor [Candidatus Sulfotelmatobacter sp.]
MKSERVRKLSCVCLLLIVPLICHLAIGQNANTGEIKGTVSDSTGAVLAGVKVTITNVQTGVTTVSTTNSAGIYDEPSVPTGEYTITFEKTGFKDLIRKGITLQVQTVGIDATLQLGAATEVITVTEEASLLETETSDQHVNLTTEAIRTAPIVGTDWRAQMIQLIPGVNNGGGAGEANGQGAGVNGTQGYNIQFLSDGGVATAPRDYNGSNYYMPLDSIGEVSINSANAPAQYGNGLLSVNVITKSGTNQWHGSAYESIQNTAFNSRGYFNSTGPKAVTHWNTYGGSIGGPAIKNKLFFFFNFQRNPATSPTSGTYTYPTAAMQAGNFFGYNWEQNGQVAPTGAAFDASGTLIAPYDAVALNVQGYLPALTAPGWVAGCPGPVNPSASTPQTCPTTSNYIFNGSSPNTATWYTGKADYNISSKQRVSFSFNDFPTTSSYVPADPLFPNDATAYEQGKTHNLLGQVSHLFTFSSTVLNEFRVSASRELDKYKPFSLGHGVPAKLGMQPTYGTNAPADIFPRITIDTGGGNTNFGGGINGNGNIDAVLGQGIYTVGDILTLIRGKHTIKVGGEYDRLYQNYTSWGDMDSGHFEFNGGVTGIPYADFLAGDVYGWYVAEAVPTSAHEWTSAVFASDDFKVTPKLTLNLGLRWQMQSGWGVKDNLFGVFDPHLPNPAGGNGAILFGGQSDLLYGGTTANMKTIQNGDYNEFAPRLGLAWSPRNNWVFRASYGIFDAPRDAENYTDNALALGLNPHQVGPNGYVNGQAAFKLAAGPPAGTMVVFPTLQTLSPTINNFGYTAYYPRSMPTVYVQQSIISVQHDFAKGILLDSSYVYTRGRNLNFSTDINQAPPSQFTCSGYNCGAPNPVFNNIIAQIYTGYSNYNALQERLQKRMSNGLTFQVNYAWSKWLDTGTGNGHGSGVDIYQNAFDPAANYGPANGNAAHTLVGQVVYQLPYGRGRRFPLHGIVDQVAGGWTISSLFQWHTGTPFTPVIQGSVASGIDPGLRAGTLYPDLVGDPHVSNPSVNQWFNPAAYANPAPGTFGNVSRNSLVGPAFSNVNIGIAKEFPIHESMGLEIKANAYNAFNHVNFNNPNANVGDSGTADTSAGKLTGIVGGQRIIELGAHFRF